MKRIKGGYSLLNDGKLYNYTSLKEAQDTLNYFIKANSYQEYETATIEVFNIINRKVANYYFSKRDFKWHKIIVPITDFYSWNKAKNPFKNIAQFILDRFGFKQKQEQQFKDAIESNK